MGSTVTTVRRALLALVAVTLAACSGPQVAGAPEARPIDEVVSEEIVVEPDPSGTSATLRLTSDVPLACAVVYGTGDGFGLLATDDDMAGGAHTEHSPVMRGLQPETTYSYRVQGSDAAGNFYASEVMEFTTPAAREVRRPGPNVAPDAAVADVSSEFSDAFAAENALDGDPATEWSTAGDGDDASITIGLGAPTELVGVGVRSRSMGDGTAVVRRYEVTLDGERTLGPFDAGTGELVISELAGTASEVTVDAVETTGGNTGLVDLELYAAG